MSEQTVARRYAQTLYEEAESRDCVETVDEDIALLRETLDEVREFSHFINNPVIPKGKKKDVLKALLEERVEPLTLRFVQLLVEKERETTLARIVETYQNLRDDQRGIVEVSARVAHPLDDEARQELVDELEAMSEQRVRLKVEHDPELIGGLIIRMGDRVYDGSVRQKLSNLHDRWSSSMGATNGASA